MADVTFQVNAKMPIEELTQKALQAAEEIKQKWNELAKISYHESGHPPGSWPALKETTLKRKRNIVEDPSWMLLRTGKMIDSNQFEIGRGNNCVIVYATNTAQYWKFHELGTKNIPARPQLDPELYNSDFKKIIEKYFFGK